MKELQSYTNAKTATIDLPYGNLANETKSGGNNGTPIVAEQMQDLYYCIYQVLQLAGELPNGELEDGNLKKQFIQALCNIGIFKYSAASKYSKGNIVLQNIDGAITFYRSLINNNTDNLTNVNSWKKLLTIEKNNRINFFVETNISGSGNAMPIFCFNSGPIDENGEALLLTIENNIVTQHSPAVCTTASGDTYSVSEDVSLDISGLADGSYNLFYNPDTNGLEIYNNKIFKQKAEPSDWNLNDVWIDTSVMPYVSKIKKSDNEILNTNIVYNAVIVFNSDTGGGATNN